MFLVLVISLVSGFLIHKLTWKRTAAKGTPWSRIVCYFIGIVSIGTMSIPAAIVSESPIHLIINQSFIVIFFGSGVMTGYVSDNSDEMSHMILDVQERVDGIRETLSQFFRLHGHV